MYHRSDQFPQCGSRRPSQENHNGTRRTIMEGHYDLGNAELAQ
jgi:hypothetical protein